MQCLYYPQLSANYRTPFNFVDEISDIAHSLYNDEAKHEHYNRVQDALENAIKEKWQDLLYLGENIVNSLSSEQGFVVVKHLPFLLYKRPILDLLFLSLTTCLGKVTVHDDSKKLVWDVTPRPHIEGRVPTFSELDVEAPMHTDSAFRQHPEEYFGLFVVSAAQTGGNSVVMRADEIIQQLERSSLGAECLAILRSNVFPFRVPPAFANNNTTKIVEAPIIANSPLVRFRLDSILSGFKCCPELATPQRIWAIRYFNHFIESYQDKLEFKLNDGDIIFVNNHTILHSRTAFQGNNRLLLRVRVEKALSVS